MDPVTTAIMAAIAGGVASGGSKSVEKPVTDACEGLNDILKRKLGSDSDVLVALQRVAAQPEREGHRVTLCEEIQEAPVDEGLEILRTAELLRDMIQEQPDRRKLVQQLVRGDNNIFSATGDIRVMERRR